LIEYLREIHDAGVCSLKVEGRTKSEYYVAMVTRAYRKAIDDMMAGKQFDPGLLKELDKVANRGYHTGFMVQPPEVEGQNYDTSVPRYYSQKFGGIVTGSEAPSGFLAIEARNKISVGDSGEILTPDHQTVSFQVEEILNSRGESVTAAHGGSGVFFIANKEPVPPMSILSLNV
jgi:putative protease